MGGLEPQPEKYLNLSALSVSAVKHFPDAFVSLLYRRTRKAVSFHLTHDCGLAYS
ncbi:hypothetical protein ES703_41736 [subsurface metagenome]